MKIEPKQLLQDLKAGWAWPVYWVAGSESYRVREVCNLLRKTLVGDRSWAEDHLEGAQIQSEDVLSSAASIPLDGACRVVWVREAHLIKDPERLSTLFGAKQKASELPSVCIFLSKELDGRRKFTKTLMDEAAVVLCEEVQEEQRETWVKYLAQSAGIDPQRLPMDLLTRSEPWSLDWVKNELEKWTISEAAQAGSGNEVLVGGGQDSAAAGEAFIEAFLGRRELAEATRWIAPLSRQPELALPLMGLLSWNVRMMALLAARSRSLRLAPSLESRLRRALARWSEAELGELQSALAELDFCIKQTPQEPLALWGVLVQKFCR
jgi:DNA polymerase III delta subunit